jgi:hypothetical protein
MSVGPAHAICTRAGRRFTVAVQWSKDVDTSLAEAKDSRKPILLDFSAAPA